MSATLLQTIDNYRALWNVYAADEADDLPKNYEPAWKQLLSWDQPARTPREAVEALRLAIEMYDVGDTPVIPSMMKAAHGYLQTVEKAETPVTERKSRAEKIASFMLDVEPDIHEAKHMSDIAAEALDSMFSPSATIRSDADSRTFRFTLHEIDQFTFLVNGVASRCSKLRKQFREAYRTGART